MEDYAGRVLADRYRLPAAVDAEPIHTRAFDTYSGQDVLIGQVPLPEIVEAELIEDGGRGADPSGYGDGAGRSAGTAVQRAMDAARSAAAIPDHPRLAQVFDVFEEGGSLWIVSELVPARTLEGLLEERPLSPYRGAEVAADILTALRALHAHGWTHRNITTRTVLVCDDGRVVLTGLASGAAEEALCGYDPLPPPPDRGQPPRPTGSPGPPPGVTPVNPDPAPGPGLLGDPADGRLPQLPDPATGFLPAQHAPRGAGRSDGGVLPPGWNDGPGPYGGYGDGSADGADARGGAGPYGTPPYDEDDEVWRSAPYGAGGGDAAGAPGGPGAAEGEARGGASGGGAPQGYGPGGHGDGRGAQGGSEYADGPGAPDDGADRWPFGAWQQGGAAPGAAAGNEPGGRGRQGPGAPGGGPVPQRPYGDGQQGGAARGAAGAERGAPGGGGPGDDASAGRGPGQAARGGGQAPSPRAGGTPGGHQGDGFGGPRGGPYGGGPQGGAVQGGHPGGQPHRGAQGGAVYGAAGNGPGGQGQAATGGGQARRPQGGQPGGGPGGYPGRQHVGGVRGGPPGGGPQGGPAYGAAAGSGAGGPGGTRGQGPGVPDRGPAQRPYGGGPQGGHPGHPGRPGGHPRGGSAPAGGGQAGDQTPAARAGVMAAYQAGTRAAEARLAGGAGGAGGSASQGTGRPVVPGQSARTPGAGPPGGQGGSMPSARGAGPTYSDRIEIGGDRPVQGGAADPARQATGSPDAGAPWDDLPNDPDGDGYDEYGTSDPYGGTATAARGGPGAPGPGVSAAPGGNREQGAPGGSAPHGGTGAPGGAPAAGGSGSYQGAGTHGAYGAPGGARGAAGSGSYGGPGGSPGPGEGPGSYGRSGAAHGGPSAPGGPGTYGGPRGSGAPGGQPGAPAGHGGPGAYGDSRAGGSHVPGGSRGPGAGRGGPRGSGGYPGGPGPGAYGTPGGSRYEPRPAGFAEPDPQPQPLTDSLPGGASYGGSLPGVRPGASIAVSVGAQAEPASRDELPGPEAGGATRYPGPGTRLAAERARQTRMQVVGAVTERWAPEQAGPIHEHWQLAPPVGPAADLWALGALLFRAVQGHPAYPEEDVGELVQLVCSEPAAHAEECGALRPVVESLLRQDPTERPDFEELRGWLRSLIRTAPEPGIGSRTVTVPQHGTGRGGDPRRLPILRRRGELMRRRRANKAPVPVHARHKRGRSRRGPRGPRSLGRTLIALVFVAMAGAIAYAAMFMPGADEGTRDQRGVIGAGRGDEPGESAAPPADPAEPNEPEERRQPKESDDPDKPKDDEQGGGADSALPDGFTLRKDPAGFEVAVREDWQRVGGNDNGQVRYVGGDYELVVVPGRDGVDDFGSDPMTYQQQSEPELDPYRDAAWAQSTGLRLIEVGQRVMAEGEFEWTESGGRQVHARNLAMVWDDSYHVVLLIGPDQKDAEVERFHRIAAESYRPTK